MWNTTPVENGNKTIKTHKDGETKEDSYPSNLTLTEAIGKTASKYGLSTVIVKCDGNEVQPDAGNRQLSEFNTIELFPKFAGAC